MIFRVLLAIVLICSLGGAVHAQLEPKIGDADIGQAPSRPAEQIAIDEIVRKAENKLPENGFCAGTGWPLGDNFDVFKAWLESASVGTWKVNRYANGACELNRVTRIHHDEKTGRCVSYSRWNCRRGATCLTGSAVDCLDKNGKLTTSD